MGVLGEVDDQRRRAGVGGPIARAPVAERAWRDGLPAVDRVRIARLRGPSGSALLSMAWIVTVAP